MDPAASRPLQYGEVHIWQIRLDDPVWDAYSGFLSQDERTRAARYRTEQLQKYFSRCRSALRVVLGRYIDQAASELIFHYGEYGKPTLPGHLVQFNLSHSADYALIAVSSHVVGIDIECMGRKNVDLASLIDMVCHPEEKSALALLPETEKAGLFYKLWSHKESYCKFLGVGLQQSLSALHFRPAIKECVSQVCVDKNDCAPPCFVHDLNMLEGYSTSLCFPLAEASIRLLYF